MPAEKYYTVETTLRVRYAETDSMRIVHHSNYIVYFEEGRSAYARQRGHAYSEIEDLGYFLLVTEATARYHKPAYYEDQITIRTWVSQVKSRGLTFNYEIINAQTGERLVTGQTRHICVTQDGKIAKLPQIWRDWDITSLQDG